MKGAFLLLLYNRKTSIGRLRNIVKFSAMFE
jgi:hypothetical protein